MQALQNVNKWGIRIVTPDWLSKSAYKKEAVPETAYFPKISQHVRQQVIQAAFIHRNNESYLEPLCIALVP